MRKKREYIKREKHGNILQGKYIYETDTVIFYYVSWVHADNVRICVIGVCTSEEQ